jgi:hypothetical protein
MVGSESKSEFLVRIRILQKNSDYFGFGSTTLDMAIHYFDNFKIKYLASAPLIGLSIDLTAVLNCSAFLQ